MTFTGNSLAGRTQPFPQRLAERQLGVENPLRPAVGAVPHQVVERSDHSDADAVVRQRDVPEPGVLVAGVQDQGGPFVDPPVADAPLEMGEDRGFLQRGLVAFQL